MTEDTRPRVPLDKRIDLEQLTAEVGTALSASATEVVVADPATKISVTALKAAVAAHVPPPAPAPVPPLTDAEIVAIRAHLGATPTVL